MGSLKPVIDLCTLNIGDRVKLSKNYTDTEYSKDSEHVIDGFRYLNESYINKNVLFKVYTIQGGYPVWPEEVIKI